MTETITAVYDSPGKVRNAVDDLVASGIPQEKIFTDGQTSQVKVVVPETAGPEIKEILQRHQPARMSG